MRKPIKFIILAVLGAASLLAVNYAATSQNDNKYLVNVVWAAPATAATLQGDNQSNKLIMEIEPTGTIAALTVNLEPQNQLRIGSHIELCFTQAVVALTINGSAAGGATIKGTALTAAAITGTSCYKFDKISLGTGSGAIWRRND